MTAPCQPLCGRCGTAGPFGWSLPGGGFIRACGAQRDDAEAVDIAREVMIAAGIWDRLRGAYALREAAA